MFRKELIKQKAYGTLSSKKRGTECFFLWHISKQTEILKKEKMKFAFVFSKGENERNHFHLKHITRMSSCKSYHVINGTNIPLQYSSDALTILQKERKGTDHIHNDACTMQETQIFFWRIRHQLYLILHHVARMIFPQKDDAQTASAVLQLLQ